MLVHAVKPNNYDIVTHNFLVVCVLKWSRGQSVSVSKECCLLLLTDVLFILKTTTNGIYVYSSCLSKHIVRCFICETEGLK